MTPPGWYPDPWRMAPWRWWDGTSWTGQVYGQAYPQGAALAGGQLLATARATEERWWPRARVAVGVFAALSVAQCGVFLGVDHRFLAQIHKFIRFVHSNNPNKHFYFNASLPGYAGLSNLASLLLLMTGVVFLIWQSDAANVARGLGYPARHSPGLGVASWFIPIINLWFPYQALTDCLPPSHPLRRMGLWAWLAYLGAGLFDAAAAITAIWSVGIAIGVLILAIACWVSAVLLGCKLIAAINESHRQASDPVRL